MGSRVPRGRVVNLGIDIGGTKILAVRANGRSIDESVQAKTPKSGPAAVAARVAAMADKLDPERKMSTIGIGIPGVVANGDVLVAPNLAGWDPPVAFAAMLREVCGRSVVVDNDVNLATLAEHRLGSNPPVENLLGVFVGTGVGGGLILDGTLRSGPHGLAGELGHVTVVNGGALCSCGGMGHLEAYAGRACLEQRAREAYEAGRSSALVELAPMKRMTSTTWATATKAGDPLANELLASAAQYLGQALATVASVVDIEQVVLGGGFALRLGSVWRRQVAESMHSHLVGARRPAVLRSSIGDAAGALGAALRAGQGTILDPAR